MKTLAAVNAELYVMSAIQRMTMNDISILPLTPLQSWVFIITVFYILYRWVVR
jgi:hypothetical protein